MRIASALCVVAVAAFCFGLLVMGQEEMPMAMEEEGLGAGGPMPGWIMLDLSGLSTVLEAHGYAPFPTEGMFTMGGGGWGGLLKSWRFGGFGTGGETSSSVGNKAAVLSLGFGGFFLGYGLFSDEAYDVMVGTLIGGGGAELSLLDHRSESFDTAISNPPNTVLKRSFFTLEPQVSVAFTVLKWLSLRISGGYLVTFGGNWDQSGKELVGPPANFNAWMVQVMVSFGGKGDEEEQKETE
ncbi:MAG: hypothetical protein A2Z21_03775 [Candidatus Fraserbacteria bacterium RBG_16_55_9]|uniref:Outer membrane protein beta-barrel domain-containing protein n=1 Tax=Fraserbacteria sp. (strain RBG_16_55_9) TaxID=1817864 RepID=A0A1F5UNH3_FRAXR|nr:MAG: hypothetical protein A2Z21_03775 [Candidatus Fraserbacteria bacterium RBG_16_55_9]